MIEATYNPILGKEKLPPWRPFAPRPTPTANMALVLVGQGQPTCSLWLGDRGPVSWHRYQIMYRINMTDHMLGFDCTLPSQCGGVEFHAEVQFVCWVSDPVMITRQQIADARAVIEPLITRTMRMISRTYGMKQQSDAEQAILDAMEKHTEYGGFEISQFAVTLGLDEEERLHAQKLRQIERDQEIERRAAERWRQSDQLETERATRNIKFYNDLIKPDHGQLLILYLAHHPEEIRTVAQLLNQRHQTEREHWLNALEKLQSSDILEEFHLQKAREHVLRHFTESDKLESPVVIPDGSKTQDQEPEPQAHPTPADRSATGDSKTQEQEPELQERAVGAADSQATG